jgi:hypothetical protein
MADVSFQPVNILTGPPQSVSVDQSPLFDDSKVTDWYTYFFTVQTSITQGHSLSSISLQSSSPELQAAALSENFSLVAANLVSGQPVLGTPGLVENYTFSAVGVLSTAPVISATSLTEDYALVAANLIVAPHEVGSATVSQDRVLVAQDIQTRAPDLEEAVDPRKAQQEIEELKQMFGGWPRRSYEVPDGRLVQAEREIERQFGQKVSIDRKAKSVLKFGKSAPLTTGSLQTVWTVGGNETYVSDNTIDSISSSSAADQEEIYIEGHTVTGTGFDQEFTFVSFTINLNGQTRVALPIPLARVSLAYNNNGSPLAGRVVVYENTALNGGIPTDVTKIHIDIPLGFQESFKAATTFSSTDYYVLTKGFGAVSGKQDGAADFYLEIREPGKTFRQVAAVAGSNASSWIIDLNPAVIIPKNCDIRVRVDSGSNNLVVFSSFQGYLAKVL